MIIDVCKECKESDRWSWYLKLKTRQAFIRCCSPPYFRGQRLPRTKDEKNSPKMYMSAYSNTCARTRRTLWNSAFVHVADYKRRPRLQMDTSAAALCVRRHAASGVEQACGSFPLHAVGSLGTPQKRSKARILCSPGKAYGAPRGIICSSQDNGALSPLRVSRFGRHEEAHALLN